MTKALSGAEVYHCYGAASRPVFAWVGGQVIWSGAPPLMLIGPADEGWDTVFVARYPTAAAFLSMVTDPIYRDAVVRPRLTPHD